MTHRAANMDVRQGRPGRRGRTHAAVYWWGLAILSKRFGNSKLDRLDATLAIRRIRPSSFGTGSPGRELFLAAAFDEAAGLIRLDYANGDILRREHFIINDEL